MRKERNAGFEYLRAIGCIAVIFIHVIYSGILMYGQNLSFVETVAYRSILNCLMWAVPCFIMVTGALLLDPEKQISYDKLFSKYIWRIIKAIVIFGVIFTLLECIFSNDGTGFTQWWTGLIEIFTGKTWSHMWYLYCLVGLYLLLPFYKMVTANAGKKELEYLLLIYLFFLSLIPLLKIWNTECGFYIHVSSIYPFWLFLGYYLNRWGTGKSTLFYSILGTVGTGLLVILTFIRWKYNLDNMEILFGYSSIFVIMQTTGIAGFFFKVGQKESSFWDKILKAVDGHSFGIYLIHLIFVRGMYKHLHFNPFEYGGMLGIIGMVSISFVLSYVIDGLLKKIAFFEAIL